MSEDQMNIVVKFPDESMSFRNGFEAGMIWQEMQMGVDPIERNAFPVNVENHEVLENMANSAGYEIEYQDDDNQFEEWTNVVFNKRRVTRGHLSVVPS